MNSEPPAPAPPSPPPTPIRGPVEAWAALGGRGPTDAERATVLKQMNGTQRSFGGTPAPSMFSAADAVARERLEPDTPPMRPDPIEATLPCRSTEGAGAAARVLSLHLDAIRAEQPAIERGSAWRIKRWAAGAAALTFEIKELRAEREKQRKPAPNAQRRRARFEVVPRSNERERDD